MEGFFKTKKENCWDLVKWIWSFEIDARGEGEVDGKDGKVYGEVRIDD